MCCRDILLHLFGSADAQHTASVGQRLLSGKQKGYTHFADIFLRIMAPAIGIELVECRCQINAVTGEQGRIV